MQQFFKNTLQFLQKIVESKLWLINFWRQFLFVFVSVISKWEDIVSNAITPLILSIYKLSYRQNQTSLTVTAKSFARNALWWNGPTRPIRFQTGSLPSQVFGTTIPRAGSPCTPTTPYCLNNFREPPNVIFIHIQRKKFTHLIVCIWITS